MGSPTPSWCRRMEGVVVSNKLPTTYEQIFREALDRWGRWSLLQESNPRRRLTKAVLYH